MQTFIVQIYSTSEILEMLHKFTDYVSLELALYGPIALLIFFIVFNFLTSKRTNIPAVKGGYPFFGQVFTMIKGSPWDTMTEWALKYGRVYRFILFGYESVVVSDPGLLKTILFTKLSCFRKDTDWTYKPFMVLLGNGLVTSEGESWRKQRTLLSSYLRIEILEEIPMMALKAVKRLGAKLDETKLANETIEMAEAFRKLTLHVITEAILSLPADESDETFAQMYLPIVEEGNLRTWNPTRAFILNSSWFEFRKAVKRLNHYVTELVEKRWTLRMIEAFAAKGCRRAPDRKHDTLDKRLSAVDKEEWGDEIKKQIRDEVKTFILAGHETSASMLSWALYELTCNESYFNRVRSEAKALYEPYFDKSKKSATDATFESIQSLPTRSNIDAGLIFTECCLREALRKYSNVPTVVRVAKEDLQYENYFIPKGSKVMLNLQGVHHDPEFWPDPLAYKPERFLEEVKPYTFVPFTEGPRMCLGQYLSLLESKIVLSLLVYKYDFKVSNKETAGLKHPFMVPIIPKVGHHMKISCSSNGSALNDSTLSHDQDSKGALCVIN
jgi:cytochrome P450